MNFADRCAWDSRSLCRRKQRVVEPVDWRRNSALHEAAAAGDLERVRALSESIDVMAADIIDGFCPAHGAALRGHVAVVQYLLSERLFDWRVPTMCGATVLHLACSGGHVDMVRTLVLEHKCDPAVPNEIRPEPGYPLSVACAAAVSNGDAAKAHGALACVSFLLSRLTRAQIRRALPLHNAVYWHGCTGDMVPYCVRLVIGHVSLTDTDNQGQTERDRRERENAALAPPPM
jgi:ankyrin repeat protein